MSVLTLLFKSAFTRAACKENTSDKKPIVHTLSLKEGFLWGTGLLAILAKSIAIPITIFCGKSIAIAIAIQLLKKYCNTNTNTPSNTNKQSILSGEVRCSLL